MVGDLHILRFCFFSSHVNYQSYFFCSHIDFKWDRWHHSHLHWVSNTKTQHLLFCIKNISWNYLISNNFASWRQTIAHNHLCWWFILLLCVCVCGEGGVYHCQSDTSEIVNLNETGIELLTFGEINFFMLNEFTGFAV